MMTSGSSFTFQTIERGQDTSQDLTWLLFGYNPNTNTWAYVGQYDQHPRIDSLVEHAHILLDCVRRVDTASWKRHEKICVQAFQTYFAHHLRPHLPYRTEHWQALVCIHTFLRQHGKNAACHEAPCDFQQAPSTSHSTQMQVKVTLEECNTTTSRLCNICFSYVVPARLLQHRVFGGWLCRLHWHLWRPCNLRRTGTSIS